MTSFSEAQKFLELNFIRKLVHSRSICMKNPEPFCYDMAWKVSDDLHVHRRVQVNGLNKTLLFVKKVGVIQMYDMEDNGRVDSSPYFNYTKVCLLEKEIDDYMRNVCYPYEYKGDGIGAVVFSIVYPPSKTRRRIDIMKIGDFYSQKENGMEFLFTFFY